MNLVRAILLKIASALLFALMQALVRWLGDSIPLGQVVFYRSAFAILPVVVIFAWRGELGAAVRTGRPFGQAWRGTISVAGMFLNFAALARLPLVDATAISFAAPLITVAFAAIFLGERVRIYRWSAVGVGFLGVLVTLWPHLEPAHLMAAGSTAATIGATCAMASAFTNAGSVIQTRRLTDSESTSSIVFYFSLICAFAGLATWPFGWVTPNAAQFAALVALGVFGGLAHILLTESYRHAPGFGYRPVRLYDDGLGLLARLCAVRRDADEICLHRRDDYCARRLVRDLARASARPAANPRGGRSADCVVRVKKRKTL